jgi:hypothetical protein
LVGLAREPTYGLVGLAAIAAVTVLFSACTDRVIVATPTPVPPTNPPQDASSVGLLKGDLPGDFGLCPTSGDINRYLQLLLAGGSPSYEVTANQWAIMRNHGAEAGWVSSFTKNPIDCDARVGERRGPSAISFTIRFRTAKSAADAFHGGFFGLKPAPGMSRPGLVQGDRTQLGPDSWIYDQTGLSPSIWTAYWAKHEFVLFVLVERSTAAVARQAATGMNERVR